MRTAVTISGCAPNTMSKNAAGSHIVQLPNGTIYVFVVKLLGTTDIAWTKSTDGGGTWSALTNIFTTNTVTQFALWYDRWSAIDADIIHLAYVDTSADAVYYAAFDTSTDSLGTQRTVFDGATTADTNEAVFLSICLSTSGYIYIAYCIDALAEYGFSYSTNAGVGWNSAANRPQEAAEDKYILMPAYGASNDIMCIYHDHSANELSRKIFTYSTLTWAEASISTGITKGTYGNVWNGHFKAIADGDIVYVAAWTAHASSATLKAWTVAPTEITALTDIIATSSSGSAYQYNIALTICNGVIYAYYHGISGLTDWYYQQSPSLGIIAHKYSTDAGATWSAEYVDNELAMQCRDGIETPCVSYSWPIYAGIELSADTRGVYHLFLPYKTPASR